MEKKRLSVGFADLTHYAKLFERMSAEEAVGILQERLEAAGEVISRHGGEIQKYVGDAILFTFEEPSSAVAAARELAALPSREVEGLSLRYHAAVATGEVVCATVGHPSHRVEDLFGATVNRAAHLLGEAARNESGVALCEETRKLA